MAHEAELTEEDFLNAGKATEAAGPDRTFSELGREMLERIGTAAGRKVIEYVERQVVMFDGTDLLITGPMASDKWVAMREAFGLPRRQRRRKP